MTNITKAAQDALAALDEIHAGKRHPQLALAVAQQLRAALKDKAVEVTVAIDSLYNERRDGMTNAIFPPVQIGTRLFAAQPAPVVPDDHPLVVFAKECELGTYMEHETPMAARKAISAAKAIGITAKAEDAHQPTKEAEK